jgi:hypothetical protein
MLLVACGVMCPFAATFSVILFHLWIVYLSSCFRGCSGLLFCENGSIEPVSALLKRLENITKKTITRINRNFI